MKNKNLCCVAMFTVIMLFTKCTNNIFTNRNTFGKTQITVNRTKIDLGILKQKIPKEASFTIKNTGDSVLVIQQVETSCGCTVPVWTNTPISVGDSGYVTVTYDAEYPGRFQKSIRVFANVENSPVQLSISGEVAYDETILSKQ